jgi:hypothetical protein
LNAPAGRGGYRRCSGPTGAGCCLQTRRARGGGLNSNPIRGTPVPMEEPSTASSTDIRPARLVRLVPQRKSCCAAALTGPPNLAGFQRANFGGLMAHARSRPSPQSQTCSAANRSYRETAFGRSFRLRSAAPSLFGRGMDLGNVTPWELQDSRFTLIHFVRFDQDYCSRGLCFAQCFAEIRDLISHRFATVGIG